MHKVPDLSQFLVRGPLQLVLLDDGGDQDLHLELSESLPDAHTGSMAKWQRGKRVILSLITAKPTLGEEPENKKLHLSNNLSVILQKLFQ